MRIEQDMRQRKLDGKWEVWQKMPVQWPVVAEGAPESVLQPEWVLAGVFGTKIDAIRFWNFSFAANNAQAPDEAGDGFGSSRKAPWTFALSA